MRVCQFRHFGTGASVGQGQSITCSPLSVPKGTLDVKQQAQQGPRRELLVETGMMPVCLSAVNERLDDAI